MHKNLNMHKEGTILILKRKETGGQRLTRSVEEAHQPIEQLLYFWYSPVTSNATITFCHWAARRDSHEGKILTLRRSCWVTSNQVAADTVEAEWFSEGTSAQQSHFAFPSRVQPAVSLPSNLFCHTYFMKPTFIFCFPRLPERIT